MTTGKTYVPILNDHKKIKAVYTTTRVCLYHPATRMWLYPKPRVLDTATRLMTAQSKA